MTRINMVNVKELTDQHLFAEFREIKMVPKALARSLDAIRKKTNSEPNVMAKLLASIPIAFTLNTGHVKFFYDKGEYLERRFAELRDALRLAHGLGMQLNLDECNDMNDVRTDIVRAAAAIGEQMK